MWKKCRKNLGISKICGIIAMYQNSRIAGILASVFYTSFLTLAAGDIDRHLPTFLTTGRRNGY